MSFAGHGVDMFRRNMNNLALKAHLRENRVRVREAYLKERGHVDVKLKQLSREELEQVKERVRVKLKEEQRRFQIRLSITLGIMAVALTFIIKNIETIVGLF